jgi:quercetin dioxygenase-like cupin family protein
MEQELKAEVLDLNNLINYQDGSVVSRTLIKKKTGTVTLFAFDEGQSLSEHTSPYDAMAYVLEGESEITISGEKFNLKKGEMIMLPAGKPHSVSALSKFKFLLTMIKS